MFGYVKAARAEMRVREYEYYRASYCGLCRAMGKCTGQCSRMLLSFDFAYLANVRMALSATVPTFKRRRCIAHPLRRRVMMERNGELDFCAAASAILAYEKCRDNVADERGFARLRARFACLFLKGAYRRAKKRVPALAASVREHLVRLSALEKEKTPSADALAAVFGDLLADVASYDLEGSAAVIARKIGAGTGRVIYLLDALDDLQEDMKKGRYNPFLLSYGRALTEEEKKSVKDAILLYLSDMEAAFDLMDAAGDPTRREILNNILYLGMPQAVDRVLAGKKCQKEEHYEQ
jgi:hypothetical protein